MSGGRGVVRGRVAAVGASALVAIALLAGCSSGHDADSHAGTPSSSVEATASGDVMFATMMIPHHQQAVEMADIALGKVGVSPFVVELATDIRGAQQPEIDQMSAWLTEWGAPIPSGAPSADDHADHGMAGMMTPEQMEALQAADGTDFDRMWLTMMIEHHRGAITMAEDVLATTQDDRVRELAQAVVSAQQQEIERMQAELG